METELTKKREPATAGVKARGRGRPVGARQRTTVIITLRPDQYDDLREISQKDDAPVTVLVRQAIDQWLAGRRVPRGVGTDGEGAAG